MPQFFVDEDLEPGREIKIRGRDAKHISQSLRLRSGDWLMLSDGLGRTFRAKILHSSPREVCALIENEFARREGIIPPTLALAIASREHFEWAIEKAVELGCRRIIPFASQRSEKIKRGEDAHRRIERWQRIAKEAAKQSGLPYIPRVEAPIEFQDICNLIKDRGPCFLLYEGENKQGIKEALQDLRQAHTHNDAGTLIIIGPEGGFADDEVHKAKESGAIAVSLGQQILRVETAAIAAMTILQYELGNMDPA